MRSKRGAESAEKKSRDALWVKVLNTIKISSENTFSLFIAVFIFDSKRFILSFILIQLRCWFFLGFFCLQPRMRINLHVWLFLFITPRYPSTRHYYPFCVNQISYGVYVFFAISENYMQMHTRATFTITILIEKKLNILYIFPHNQIATRSYLNYMQTSTRAIYIILHMMF